MKIFTPQRVGQRGFSLLEMLVSTTVLVLIMGVVLTTLDFVSDSWKRTTSSVETFENARAGFIKMNDLLSQATLNTYSDYYDEDTDSYRTNANSANFVPTTFKRQSELHFLSGPSEDLLPDVTNSEENPGHAIFFQAPLSHDLRGTQEGESYRSVPELLNSVGFYVEFYDDTENWPGFVRNNMPENSANFRFRLIQWIEPTSVFSVYRDTNVDAGSYKEDWFAMAQQDFGDRFVIADNVILLLILPKLDIAAEIASGVPEQDADGTHIAPNFEYNSRLWEEGGNVSSGSLDIVELTRNQLPPLLEVVMVAIDEKSAVRLAAEHGSQAPPEVVPSSSLFQEASELDADLEEFAGDLADEGLNYRIFRNTVAISSAKWSPDTNDET